VMGWHPGKPSRSFPPNTTVTTGVFVNPSMSLTTFWIVPPSSADWLVRASTDPLTH